jgi:hypothetical protein
MCGFGIKRFWLLWAAMGYYGCGIGYSGWWLTGVPTVVGWWLTGVRETRFRGLGGVRRLMDWDGKLSLVIPQGGTATGNIEAAFGRVGSAAG